MATELLTREQVQKVYGASYQELMGLLRQRRCPLPVRPFAGEPDTMFWADEAEDAKADVMNTLERWRRTRRA
jgi:hypothetical protein